MKKFFSYDGPFLRVLTKIGELIMLDIIFLVCCIPIVTIGPAIISLYYAVVKNIRRDCGNPVREFFSSMKRVIGKGILYTIVIALWTAFLIWVRDWGMTSEHQVKVPVYICDFFLILTAAFTCYIFPVLSRFSVGTFKTICMTFMMSIRYFYFTVLIVGLTGILGYLVASGILPAPCILFVPSVWCFFVSFPMEVALLHYMPAPEEGEEAWYYPTKDPEKEAKKAEKQELKKKQREEAQKMREKSLAAEKAEKIKKQEERRNKHEKKA